MDTREETKGTEATTPFRTPATKEPDTRTRTKTTLGALGAQLPIGLSPGGTLVKSLAHRTWRTREEKALGKMKKSGTNVAQHVGIVVGAMCTEFASHRWPEMPEKPDQINERRVHVSQSTMGDVLYAYCFLRREVLSNIVKMNITCPNGNCAYKFTLPADLNTLEVVTVDHVDALKWEYKLADPISLRGKRVGIFRMGAALWSPLEQAAGGAINDATIKVAMLRGSICGINDDAASVVMTDDDMDEISKRDLEGMTAALDDNVFGPKMAVEGDCERCGRPYIQSINWVYDAFFSTSSR